MLRKINCILDLVKRLFGYITETLERIEEKIDNNNFVDTFGDPILEE